METTNIYFKSKGLNYYHMAIPTGSIAVHENGVAVYSIKVTDGTIGEIQPVSREEFLEAYGKAISNIQTLIYQ